MIAVRTSRSRALYLTAALQAMLPPLEDNNWTQQTMIYEDSVVARQFPNIMDHIVFSDDQGPYSI